MNQSSKSNNGNRESAFDTLASLLEQPATSGQDIVNLSRSIAHSYSNCGMSIDDIEIENIIGIDSETDTMNLQSIRENDEFVRIYDIYLNPFEESRRSIRVKLADLGKTR